MCLRSGKAPTTFLARIPAPKLMIEFIEVFSDLNPVLVTRNIIVPDDATSHLQNVFQRLGRIPLHSFVGMVSIYIDEIHRLLQLIVVDLRRFHKQRTHTGRITRLWFLLLLSQAHRVIDAQLIQGVNDLVRVHRGQSVRGAADFQDITRRPRGQPADDLPLVGFRQPTKPRFE